MVVSAAANKPGMNVAAMDTFEIERALDLPGPLPEGEHILWMDSPDWKSLAVRVFHLKALSIYFALILAAHAAWLIAEGGHWTAALDSSMRLVPLAAFALAGFLLMGWLIAKSTVYAITNRRVLMRIGVALSITVELPFKMIKSADIRVFRNGTGDLPLRLMGDDRIAIIHLWPHALPWSLKDTVPMLRAIPEASRVARIFGEALRAQLGASQQVPQSGATPNDFQLSPGMTAGANA
jgi:hypothetical protein